MSSVVKSSDSDNFKTTLIGSQFYQINSSKDTLIESKKGNILSIPKGSFINKKGKVVKDSIQIEFAEASNLDEIILSNLLIQDSSKIYESYLSFYFNATRKGEQLKINPENPIYFELSADKQVNLYKGIRDKVGNMTWDEKLKPVDYLIPMYLDILDFYPPGLETEVEKGLPFRKHEIISKELLDSLYYSFAPDVDKKYPNIRSEVNIVTLVPIYTNLLGQTDESRLEKIAKDTSIALCGINPASIKAIKDKRFQNTLISTREFETRLKTIFATCDNKILELYINNLNKNLWEIDEMAAKFLGKSHPQYSKFLEFASFKQTKVMLTDEKAAFLAKFYKESKEKIENELLKQKQEFIKSRQRREEITQQKQNKYKELLEARYKYRMKKFGFELTEVGWYNAACEIKLNEVEKFNLNISIDNGSQFDRVYAYVINPKIKSIFSYTSSDKTNFNIVYPEDPDLLLWKNQEFDVIGIGYKDNQIGYNIEKYIQQKTVYAKLNLLNKDTKSFKEALKIYTEGYNRENKIFIDLEYQAFFYQEKQRLEKEDKEIQFINNIRKLIFPCCFKDQSGTFTFRNTKLSDVFRALENHFNVTIHLQTKETNNIRLTGEFKDETINRIIEIICATLNLKYYKDENNMFIMYIN
jgi:hypothetical protein